MKWPRQVHNRDTEIEDAPIQVWRQSDWGRDKSLGFVLANLSGGQKRHSRSAGLPVQLDLRFPKRPKSGGGEFVGPGTLILKPPRAPNSSRQHQNEARSGRPAGTRVVGLASPHAGTVCEPHLGERQKSSLRPSARVGPASLVAPRQSPVVDMAVTCQVSYTPPVVAFFSSVFLHRSIRPRCFRGVRYFVVPRSYFNPLEPSPVPTVRRRAIQTCVLPSTQRLRQTQRRTRVPARVTSSSRT